MQKGATFSVIGADIIIKGNIQAKSDLHIDGNITGDLDCAALVLGETGQVDGHITTEKANISGQVKGSVSAKDLHIAASARIYGDVHYESIHMEKGAIVEGALKILGKSAAKTEKTPQNDAEKTLIAS